MYIDEMKKMFNSLSPTTSFLVGFIGAVLGLCTVGFFVFVGLMINGNLSYKQSTINVAQKLEVENAVPSANQPAAAVQPSNQDLTQAAGTVKAVGSKDYVRGDAGAKVTLIEYSDFECPFCKRFHSSMVQLMAAYPGKIKWVYRHYPLSFHANAAKESEAAECAGELGGNKAFWSFTDKVYERTTSNGTGFALEDLPKLAVELGLNKKSFTECLDSGKYKNAVAQSLSEGTAAGVQGTPGTIIITATGEKKLIKGALPLEMLKPIIDAAL